MNEDTSSDQPMRRVTNASVHAGGSLLVPTFKYRWWELTLECGHTVERRMRYLPPADGSRPPRGYAAQHGGVPTTRVPPAPKRARCPEC